MSGRPTQKLPGGILAVPSNAQGRLSRDEFTIVPEVNFNVSLQLHPCLRLFAGYNAMYWSSVTRAGDHVSNIVDSRQIPTDANFVSGFQGIAPTRPNLISDSFFAHGLNVGLEFGF